MIVQDLLDERLIRIFLEFPDVNGLVGAVDLDRKVLNPATWVILVRSRTTCTAYIDEQDLNNVRVLVSLILIWCE